MSPFLPAKFTQTFLNRTGRNWGQTRTAGTPSTQGSCASTPSRSLRDVPQGPGLLHPSAPIRGTRGHPRAYTALTWLQKKLHTWSLRFFQRRLADRNPHSCWVRRSRARRYILPQGAWTGSALLGGWWRCLIFLLLCWSGKSFCSDEYSSGQKTYEKQRKEEKTPTVCTYLHLQIKNIINMTISYVKMSIQQNQKREEAGAGYIAPQYSWAVGASVFCRISQ